MLRRLQVALGLIGWVLVTAPSSAAPPKAAESEFLRTTGAGLMIEGKSVFYALTVEIKKPLPDGSHLEFTFDNPGDKKSPLSATKRLEVDAAKILVESVPLACIKNNRKYSIKLEVFSDEARSELVTTHKQAIEFRMPKSLIKQMGITTC